MAEKFLRYILGFILLGIIIAAFNYSKLFLFVLSVFFIIIAMAEYRNMFKTKNIYPHKFLPELTGILCAYVFIFLKVPVEQVLILPLIILGTILSFSFTVIFNKKPYLETSLSSLAAILLIICGLYIIKITYFFADKISVFPILIYFSAVLAGDFMASIIGPYYKKIKLAPDISPNKTLLGAVTHIITAGLICCLYSYYMDIHIWQCILLGIVLSVFSQLGDLTVSTIKRSMEIKHSGNFFYDYGGILDRMDAFIFSAPAVYYFLNLIVYINN